MAFGGVNFPVSQPRIMQPTVIQQQAAPQHHGGGIGDIFKSVLGMGLNMVAPGAGTLATGLMSGSPQQAISGIAGMAGLDTGGASAPNMGDTGSNIAGAGQSATGGRTEGSSSGGPSDKSDSSMGPAPEQQKIDDPNQQQNNGMQFDPQQIQQFLAMMYLQQMMQGMNPSMFPMPFNPSQGMNPAARSPITGGQLGVA